MAPTATRRNTKQRQVILEELQKLNSHPSANALYEIVRKRLPNVSLGTVYRNLDLLARSGVIRKLNVSQAGARFDGRIDMHYHLTCASCGKVEDVEHAPAGLIDCGVDELQGFRILGHQLQFSGICPDCKSAGRRELAGGPR